MSQEEIRQMPDVTILGARYLYQEIYHKFLRDKK
jgi:hypothetical protein